MHIFIERIMRGGISCISTRFSITNNEYCPNYDKNKPEVYINYHDMNNLCGYSMSEYLPCGGFKWVKVNNETVNRILNKSDNSLHGYFLEVDLDYPGELHDIHNDYQLASEKIKIEGGTKSKMYSILDLNNCEKSVCKLHTSNIGHSEFIDIQSNEKFIRHIMKRIKSFNHRMYTYESNKMSLSAFDDKR